jgi:type III secretion system FlhB-like substrate exporter
LARALDESSAPWMVIGGYAVIARGVKRMTTDVDVVVRGDAVKVDDLVDLLRSHHIEPRIPDAIAFARANLVLLLRDRDTGVHVDLSFAWSGFEHEALDHRGLQEIGDVEVPIARPEDLVVYKVMAGRPHDMVDAETLLLLYPEVDERRIRRLTKDFAEHAEAPEMVDRLEALLAAVKRLRT